MRASDGPSLPPPWPGGAGGGSGIGGGDRPARGVGGATSAPPPIRPVQVAAARRGVTGAAA
eukprot:4711916-Pleurochrysis_carterae.AAC.1